MQERIGGPYEPIKYDPKKAKTAEEKTNPVLFEQIKEYVNAQARSHLLLQALGFLELINQDDLKKRAATTKENLSEEFLEKALPADQMAKSAAQKVKNASSLIPLLQDYQKAMASGDYKRAFALLQEMQLVPTDPKKASLPEKAQKEMQSSLKPLLEAKNPKTGKTLNSLLFQTQVGQIVVAAQGNWGNSEPMILSSLMDKLKQLANATPPSPFADLAKELMGSLQGDDAEELLKELLQNSAQQQKLAEEEAAATLESKKDEPEVQNAPKAAADQLAQNVGPKGLYETYLQEIQSQTAAQTVQQGLTKITMAQKQYLTEALQVMKKGSLGDPTIAKLVGNLVALKIPPETDQEVQDLQKFLDTFYETYNSLVQSKKLSRVHQREFLDKTKEFCDESIKTIDNESDKQLAKVATLNKQLESVEALGPYLGNVGDVLSSLEAGEKLTPAQLQNFSAALVEIQSKYSALTPKQKYEIDTLMEELTKLAPDDKSLASIMAANHLHALTSEFAGVHKNPRVETLHPWLEQEIVSLKQKEGSQPLWGNFLASLDQQSKAPEFPDSASALGIPFAAVSGGIFTVNPGFTGASAKSVVLDAAPPQKAVYLAAVVSDTVDDTSSELKKQIAGVHQGAKTLEAHKNSFYSARADAENKKLLTPASEDDFPPLPWQFANVIFDKVIPNQDAALLQAGSLLSMFNSYSTGCNTTLSDLAGWDSTDYDLSNWIGNNDSGKKDGSGNEIYNGSPTQAYGKATGALSQSATDYGKLYSAANDIQNEINAIPNPPANSYQVKRLKELQGDLSNLIDGNSFSSLPNPSTISQTPPITGNPFAGLTGTQPCALTNIAGAYNNYGQIANQLQTQLGQTPTPTTFVIAPANTANLSANESAVMNGASGTTGQGLNEIYTTISGEQTNYSGFSQQQQMQLQLTMTETQQMFSTITSAMQDLNQSYSSIAQAISK